MNSINLERTSLEVEDLFCFYKDHIDRGDGIYDNATYVCVFLIIRLELHETTKPWCDKARHDKVWCKFEEY